MRSPFSLTALLALTAAAAPLEPPTPVLAERQSSPTPSINAGKRGLAYNDPALTQPFSLSGQSSRVSWGYNWASDPYQGVTITTSNQYNLALRYIPMLWNNNSVLTTPWARNVKNAVANYRADAVLAFNEPDLCQDGSACMSVASAVSGWKTWIQPFAGNVTLVSPAVSNSAAAGQGLSWLSSFMGNCTGCRVDALALHWYGQPGSAGANDFVNYLNAAYARFKLPIWVTEFGTNGGSEADKLAFLKGALPFVANTSWISRAAFFMDAKSTASVPFLINANGTGFNSLGSYYNNGL